MTIEKIKILGAVLELSAKQHCQFGKFGPIEVNGLDWHCCLAGSSKTVPRIFIFSIVLGAEYSFYVKSIATYAPTFLGYNNSVLAIVINMSLASCKSLMFSRAPGQCALAFQFHVEDTRKEGTWCGSLLIKLGSPRAFAFCQGYGNIPVIWSYNLNSSKLLILLKMCTVFLRKKNTTSKLCKIVNSISWYMYLVNISSWSHLIS